MELFGFDTIKINGHSLNSIEKVIKTFFKGKNKKPLLVYCDTIRERCNFHENNNVHGVKDLSEENYKKAISELS